MRSPRLTLPLSLLLASACASGDLPPRTLADPANPAAREGVRFALPGAAVDAASDAGADGHVHVHDHGPSAGATYTCPMHPEVVQDHPGTCPKCGMTLKVKP
jgi:hypothetical protein